jgi:peptide-methionine (S)-S-oxide reductase
VEGEESMNYSKIVVAGGCFWGVEEYYRRLKGTISTRVGYAQGNLKDPSYYEVKTGTTNHAEVVEVTYDSTVISLPQILDHLFRMIDPTSLNKQGGDIGTQYRTGVYYLEEKDRLIIEQFIQEKQKEYSAKIVVEVQKLILFYDAEDYHQKYLIKNPRGYCHVDFSTIKPEEKK